MILKIIANCFSLQHEARCPVSFVLLHFTVSTALVLNMKVRDMEKGLT